MGSPTSVEDIWSGLRLVETKYLQQTLGIPQSLLGHKLLARQTPRLITTFSNRRCGTTDCLQLLPQLPKIFSTDSRSFEPGAVTPLKPSEILTPGGHPECSLEAFSICIIDRQFLIFLCLCGLRTPLNAKITAARCSYPFNAHTLKNSKD